MRKKKNGKVTWNDVRDFLDNELRDRPFEPHELLMKLRFIDETTSSGMSTIRHNSFQSDFFRDNEYLRRLTALRPEQPAYLYYSEKESRPDKEHKGRSYIRSPLIRRKKEEKGHDQNAIKQKEAARNQRMFGNLLGTLKEFQKQTENGKDTAQDLANKRREIEKRLEEDVKRVYSLDYVDYRAEAEKADLRLFELCAKGPSLNMLKRRKSSATSAAFHQDSEQAYIILHPAKHNDRTAQL
uniref:Pinin/SDK/MemA protein domain-containing protein n=1 Tax=Ditylenchus dipsaci TaxID=166011 RepID=A0A915E0X5_9BILA